MPFPPDPFIVDAHEDIAYHCLDYGRDFVDPGEVLCMVTLPWLMQANVRLICATYFVDHEKPDSVRRYLLNSEYHFYLELLEHYPAALRLIRTQQDLAELAQAEPITLAGQVGYPVGLIMLMEGCELLANPGEMQTWFERGVRIASLTWNGKNRYACGTFADKGGLSEMGRALLREMNNLKMIADTSHLADPGIDELLAVYQGAVCSTHTNARALCNIERNHHDRHLAEIAKRGGIVGLNLLAPLLQFGWRRASPEPELKLAVEQLTYLGQRLGRSQVGLGTDLDGGLTPANTPLGINRITDLPVLFNELQAAGWSDEELAGVRGANWWRFFEQHLPA